MMAFYNPHQMEYEINDLPIITINYLILKGITQNEISEFSGAFVCSRGQHVSPHSKLHLPLGQKPLHLCIQGPSQQSVELAVKLIEKLINEAEDPEVSGGVEIVPISCENVPQTYNLANRIMGPGGMNLQYITTQTGALVTLRGRGSGFLEPLTNQESSETMHIRLQHMSPEVVKIAKQLAKHLVKTIKDEINALLVHSQVSYQFSEIQAGTKQLNVNLLPVVESVIEAPPQLHKNVTPMQDSSKTQSQASPKYTQIPPLSSNSNQELSSIPIPKQTIFQNPDVVNMQQSTTLTTKLNFPAISFKNVQRFKLESSVKLDFEMPSTNVTPISKCDSSSTLLDNSKENSFPLTKQFPSLLSNHKSISPTSNIFPEKKLHQTTSNEKWKLSHPFTQKASVVLRNSMECKKKDSIKKLSVNSNTESREKSDKKTYAYPAREDRDGSYHYRRQNHYGKRRDQTINSKKYSCARSDHAKKYDSYYDKRNGSSQFKQPHRSTDDDRDSMEHRRKFGRFSNTDEKDTSVRHRKFSKFSSTSEKGKWS